MLSLTIKSIIKNIQSNENYVEVVKGASWTFGTRLIGLIFGYLVTLFMSRFLGAKVIGLYNITLSIFSFVYLFSNLGFSISLVRFAGQYDGDRVIVNILYKTTVTSAILSISLSMVIIIFSKFLSYKLYSDPELRFYLILFGISAPFVVIIDELLGALRGLRKIKISETIRNLIPFYNLVSMSILFFVFHIVIKTPAISYFFVNLIIFIILVYFIKVLVLNSNFTMESTITLKEILNVSIPLLVSSSFITVLSNIDKLMLGYYESLNNVGVYSIAVKLTVLVTIPLFSVNAILAPKISQLYWSEKIEDLKKTILLGTKLAFFLTLPVFLLLMLFPSFFLGIFGREFVQGKYALYFLLVGQVVNVATGPVGNFLIMTGREKIFRNIVGISMVLNIILNYLLIPETGMNGAAIATGFSNAFMYILMLFYIWRETGIYVGIKI